MRRMVLAATALPLLAALAVGEVSASEAQADTVVVHNATESFLGENPCTGDAAIISITYNAVTHMTTLPSGEVHLSSTLTGTFSLEPLDASLPSYSGHLLDWSNQIYNRNEDLATFTTRARGVGSDGSRIRLGIVAHVTADTVDVSTDPPTTTGLKVTFRRFTCAA